MHARDAIHIPQNLCATDTWMQYVRSALSRKLGISHTNTIDTGENRILDVVELEASRHVGYEADGVSTVDKLERVAKTKLLHDA